MAKSNISNFKVATEALLITVSSPNKETVSAIHETEKIAKDTNIKGYHDIDEFFADLDV